MGGGGGGDDLTGLLAGGITTGGDVLGAALKKLGAVCCHGGAPTKGNHTVLCKVLKKFNKNFKCFEKMMSAYEDATASGEATSGYVGESSQGSRPVQIARGYLGAELFRLEDIIGNLNKKIDIIGDRVTKRPNQLARASLMAGMTSTFGDLQNTVELLNQKLDSRMQPGYGHYGNNGFETLEEQNAKANEIKILSKQLEQLGGVGWLGSKGFGLGLHRHEQELKEAQRKGMEQAQLKSSERLEELMHLVADRVMGLTSHLGHSQEEVLVAGNGADPIVRQEEDNLMAKQLQIQHEMALVQTGLQALTGAVTRLQDVEQARQSASTIRPPFIKLVQKVLGNAANAFRGIAKQTSNSGSYLVSALNRHVAHADSIGDHLVAAGHTIDNKLENFGINNLSNGGVSGLVDSLAASYGNTATGNVMKRTRNF